MNQRESTIFAMGAAVLIVFLSVLIPRPSWGTTHGWIVPIVLGAEAAIPFVLAGAVAAYIAKDKLLVPLTVIWTVYWFFGAYITSKIGPFSDAVGIFDFFRFNVVGIVASFIGGLFSAYVVDRTRRLSQKNLGAN